MDETIYRDIAQRTQGSIYLGIVGPVRTGKSTLIKRLMDTLVLPNISGDSQKERAVDELPQSAAGRTIMTTEPKFIPEEAVEVSLPSNASFRVRMIDCVGYIVPSALGYIENDAPRMVKTPWFEEPIPFHQAAEIGTKKVITEHSTIGVVVTTDGSISDIPRAEYQEAEQRVIQELKEINKPFIVLLNCTDPTEESAVALANQLSGTYGVPVMPVNCLEMDEAKIQEILTKILFEFPVREIAVDIPKWVVTLPAEHWLKSEVYAALSSAADGIHHIRDLSGLEQRLECKQIQSMTSGSIDLGNGRAQITINMPPNLFYEILSETTGVTVHDEQELMSCMMEMAQTQKAYARVKDALDEVEATGYGIVMPEIEELSLQEPEIMRQGGRYGVRLRASAPSIHMMKADITTEVSPIVGSEKQSEDLVMYLMSEFEEDPGKIWDSNIFGKSLHELVNEGLHTKLSRMPPEARVRLQETLERIINEGCSGLICIIL